MPLHELSQYELCLWFFLYGAISLFAIVGNTLTIYIIFHRPYMRSVTNFFILNLAIADLTTALIAIPFKFQAALLQQWYLPSFMCKLIPFVETVSLSVSTFTLTSMAVETFRSVVFPTSKKVPRKTAIVLIFLIWFCSTCASIPYGYFHEVLSFYNETDNPEKVVFRCFPTFEQDLWWKIYNTGLTITQYFIPLIIINAAYLGIGCTVWWSKWDMDVTDPWIYGALKARKKVIRMLVIVVVTFTFCWLPYETYLVLNEFSPAINEFYYINILFFTCHWLAMSNSSLNPVIYFVFDDRFRSEYLRTFKECCHFGRNEPEDSLKTEHTTSLQSKPSKSYRTFSVGQLMSPHKFKALLTLELASTIPENDEGTTEDRGPIEEDIGQSLTFSRFGNGPETYGSFDTKSYSILTNIYSRTPSDTTTLSPVSATTTLSNSATM